MLAVLSLLSGHMQQRRSGLKNKRERAKERYDYDNEREDAHVCDRLNGEFSRCNGARAVHVQNAPKQIDAQLVDERKEKSRKRSKCKSMMKRMRNTIASRAMQSAQ